MARRGLLLRLGSALQQAHARGEIRVWHERSLVETLGAEIRSLFVAVGVPAADVAVDVAISANPPSRFLFSLEADDTRCFGPLEDREPISMPNLLQHVRTTLFVHRGELLGQMLRRFEYPGLNAPADACARAAIDGATVSAVQRGLRVPQVVEGVSAGWSRGLRGNQLASHVEAVLATAAETTCRIAVKSAEPWAQPCARSLREKLFEQTGLIFPPLEIMSDPTLSPQSCQLMINQLRAPCARFNADDPLGSLTSALRSSASMFATATAIDASLGRLTASSPMLVFNAIERYGTSVVHLVLRRLIEEQVNVRDLRTILIAMLEVNGSASAPDSQFVRILPLEATLLEPGDPENSEQRIAALAEHVRFGLREQLSQHLGGAERKLRTIHTGPAIEERLRRFGTPGFSENDTYEVMYAARAAQVANAVLVTSRRLRRSLWEVIRHERPNPSVLCDEEISPFVSESVLGTA